MRFTTLLALLVHLPFIRSISTPLNCRRLPTDSDWPSPSDWTTAIPGVTPNQPLNTTTNSTFIPTYRIRAQSFIDVQNAIKFATAHNIRLSVITTGHDQLGRSDAGSGLLIDLSLLKGVKVLESFTPTLEGAESPDHSGSAKPNVIVPKEGVQAAVTFGPAVAGLALNYAVDKSGLFTMSGASATVAVAGGWGQNGGYGPLTAQYGLGVDQWLEAKIVLPSGELIIANAISNSDIFWAIRGGGGGTFGVVVEATWKAYPMVPITGFNWYINSTAPSPNVSTILETGKTPVSEAMQYLFGEMGGLKSQGISAYFYVHANNIRCFALHPGNNSGIENVEKVWEPILTKMSSFPNMTPFQTKKPVEYATYREFFDGTYGPLTTSASNGSSGSGSVPEPYNRGIVPFDSNLLSAEHLSSPNITYALRTTGGDYGVLLCAPGDRVGNGSEVSANPGWRKAVVLLVGMKDESSGTSVHGLRDLAPEMGAYINEGSTTSKDWTTSFWGTNYLRLSALKSALDPNMSFWVSPGINAHYMEARDGRACLVNPQPDLPSSIPPQMERSVKADLQRDGGFLFGRQELEGTGFPVLGEGEGFWWA